MANTYTNYGEGYQFSPIILSTLPDEQFNNCCSCSHHAIDSSKVVLQINTCIFKGGGNRENYGYLNSLLRNKDLFHISTSINHFDTNSNVATDRGI